MYIDDCRHTFESLARTVLPAHMEKLETALSHRTPARSFAITGRGRAAIARTLGLEKDFSGWYVFLDGEKPIYVGISRSVIARIRQHLRGKTHFRRQPRVPDGAAALRRRGTKKRPHGATKLSIPSLPI